MSAYINGYLACAVGPLKFSLETGCSGYHPFYYEGLLLVKLTADEKLVTASVTTYRCLSTFPTDYSRI